MQHLRTGKTKLVRQGVSNLLQASGKECKGVLDVGGGEVGDWYGLRRDDP